MFNFFRNRSKERTAELRARTWDAAGAGNRLANWSPASTDFASIITPETLRRRARDIYRNNPWGRRAVEVVTVGAVGAGIKPQFRSNTAELKAAVQREWLRWTDTADFSGHRDFYRLEQDALRAAMIDGEVIVRLLLEPGQRVPLQLQLLSAEFLDSSRVDSKTLNGIEYDAAGRRAAYWLYTQHPANAPNMQSIRVPADQVIHLYAPIQAGAERGVSWLAPALVALRELHEFIEASLVKQKIGALMTAFVTSPDGGNPLGGTVSQPPTLEPGSAVLLQPGQDVTITEPPQAGDFEPFVRAQLRAIASALGMPYELLSGDVSQVTFASGRHALLEFRRQIESIQHHLVVYQLCRPIWNAWTRLAVAAGVLPEVDYSTVRWIAPALEMLDSGAEVRALIQRVRAGFVSRSEVIARDGWDAEEIDSEIAADNARADRLGLILDSDPRKVAQQGQVQQASGNDAATTA